jgi:hypothetical protein
METVLNSVLANALQQSSGEHPIITNLGQAFVSYWTGATMSITPPPIIPSPGSIANIAQVSNAVTSPGIWQPTDKLVLDPKAEPKPKSVEELLKEIPDDNNTVEGAQEAVTQTGVNFMDDDGEDAGAQIKAVKQVLSTISPDKEPPITDAKRLDEPAGNIKGKAVKCGVGLDYEAKLSENYKVRSLSLDVVFRHKLKAQVGLSLDEIVCNLKGVAENILEPLRSRFPLIRINSAFRGTASLGGGKVSQHQKGEAIDIQIPGIAPKQYLSVAKWIIQNLDFDQLIFEHGNSIWLHISYKRSGTNRKQLLTMIRGNYEPGLICYY